MPQKSVNLKVYQHFKSNQKNWWKKNPSRVISPKATITGWRRMLIWGISSFFLWMFWKFMESGKFPAYLKTGTQKAILKLLNCFISLLHSLECANQPYSPKPLSLSYQLKSRVPSDFPKDWEAVCASQLAEQKGCWHRMNLTALTSPSKLCQPLCDSW